MDPPGIFSSFLFLGYLYTWGLIPYGGLNGRGNPKPPWVELCKPKSCGIVESPSIWLLPVGDAPRGLNPSCSTSVSPGSPPALAEPSCRNATLKSNLTGSHSWHGQDGTEPRALGSPLSPGPPSWGSLTLNPCPHPPPQCPLSPWGRWGQDTPMSPSPLAWLAQPPAQGHRGGPELGVPVALLPWTPQMSSLLLWWGAGSSRGAGGALGFLCSGGASGQQQNTPNLGGPSSLGGSTSSAGEGAVMGGSGIRTGTGGHTGGHSPIPAP